MFFKIEPHPDLQICVIIPVKDESEIIRHCLDALRLQLNEDRSPFLNSNYEVLILTNNCNDDSHPRIVEYQSKYPEFPMQVKDLVFPDERANIGNARKFLMDIAFSRFSTLKKPRGIIASTDGDTHVDRYWLSAIAKEMEKGCDVVGGEIITEFNDSPFQNYHLQDIGYHNLISRLEDLIDPLPHNPWPSHFQCFGASLAVTCDVYQKAGGLPSIPFLEDIAFCKALELKDAKIRKSPLVKVYTSSRTSGRVERGLSQHLAWFESLNNEHRELEVECAASVISRLKLKKHLRSCWQGKEIDPLVQPFAMMDLQAWVDEATYFGEMWATAEKFLEESQWFEQWNNEPISKVIQDLRSSIELFD